MPNHPMDGEQVRERVAKALSAKLHWLDDPERAGELADTAITAYETSLAATSARIESEMGRGSTQPTRKVPNPLRSERAEAMHAEQRGGGERELDGIQDYERLDLWVCLHCGRIERVDDEWLQGQQPECCGKDVRLGWSSEQEHEPTRMRKFAYMRERAVSLIIDQIVAECTAKLESGGGQ